MAEIVKTVRIETGGGERSVKSLKKEIQELRDALLNVDKGGEEWIEISKQLTKAQEDLNSVMKAGKEVIDADATSIAGMEARYKSLYATYRLLSEEQRKTSEGMSMQKELKQLSDNLNNAKKDAGNFKDNIGRYANDMMAAFSKMGFSVEALRQPILIVTQATGGFNSALKTLAKNPVIAVLGALVLVLGAVGKAIKGNEELQMRWNKVMAAFKPIGDAVALVLDKIASLAVSVAEGIAKVVGWVTNLIGLTRELSAAEADLADKENALIKNRREINEQNASDEARIAELREEASITEDITEKEKLLTEAKELQEAVNKRNIELAKQELEIIEAKNKLTPSSTADLDAESQARIKVNNAIADGEKKIRRLNNEIKAAGKSSKSATDSTKTQLDAVLKRLEENSKTEKQLLEKKYKEEKALLIKYHKDTTELEKEYQENLWKLDMEVRVKRIKAFNTVHEELANSYVQPSNSAFDHMIANAQSNIELFIDKAREFFGVELEKGGLFYGIDAEKLIDKEKLTHAAKEFSEIFGLGLEDSMDDYVINKTIGNKFRELNKAVGESIKNSEEWIEQLKIERQELEAQKKQYENTYPTAEENLNGYMEGLVNANQIERDLLTQKVEAAQKAFENVKGLAELELNTKGYTLNDQIELEREYYDALQALRDKDLEAQIDKRNAEKEIEADRIAAIHDLHQVSFDAMDSMLDTYKVLLDAYKKDGKISKQEAEKKAKTLQWLEGIQAAVAVASIVADTASGWMSINKSLAAEYVLNAETAAATGPAAAATKAALDAKSLIVANIRKAALVVNGVAAAGAAIGKSIASIQGLAGDSSDSGGGSATAAPQLIDSTPYSYTRELQTDVEREEQLNTPIYVRVTDIESAQARVRVTENESTF